jgi:hypothetical protein
MHFLSRRAFLERATKFSACLVVTPLFSPRPRIAADVSSPGITLNVVLHGLFVMNFTSPNVQLLTPFVQEHKYKAGNWDWTMATIEDLAGGKTYTLKGTDPVLAPPDPTRITCANVLSQSKQNFRVDATKSFLTIALPFPAEIRMLRCLTGKHLFNGPALSNATTISLCQVLTYPVSDPGSLALDGTHWKPNIQLSTKTANLHIWAEPDKTLLPQHAQNAYNTLMNLLPPLSIGLATDDTAPLDDPTGVLGVSPEEEQGLSEWVHGGEGSYPTNCNLLMVVP